MKRDHDRLIALGQSAVNAIYCRDDDGKLEFSFELKYCSYAREKSVLLLKKLITWENIEARIALANEDRGQWATNYSEADISRIKQVWDNPAMFNQPDEE